MTKLNELKERLCEVLTVSEMTHIKGGNFASITIDTPIALKKIADTPKIASDDKRRERPGGGISTL